MNAVAEDAAGFPAEKDPESRLREIPYNHTSPADREIVIRLLGEPTDWLPQYVRRANAGGIERVLV